MSAVIKSYRCPCGQTITAWQRWDLDGYEVVHGEGDDTPAFFITDEAARQGQGKEHAARIAEWVAELHERAGIVVPKAGYLLVGGPRDGERVDGEAPITMLRFIVETGRGEDHIRYEYDRYERIDGILADGTEEYRYTYRGRGGERHPRA